LKKSDNILDKSEEEYEKINMDDGNDDEQESEQESDREEILTIM
jgi:hypothetical protein